MRAALLRVGVVMAMLGPANAEPAPALAAHDPAVLRGWSHVQFGTSDGFKITNGVDTIVFKTIARATGDAPTKTPLKLLRGGDAHDYAMEMISCGGVAYSIVGDFGSAPDTSALLPMTTLDCAVDKPAFSFPDERRFQELTTTTTSGWWDGWVGSGRAGAFAFYAHDHESLIVQAELRSDERTPAGRQQNVEETLSHGENKAHVAAKKIGSIDRSRTQRSRVASRPRSADGGFPSRAAAAS